MSGLELDVGWSLSVGKETGILFSPTWIQLQNSHNLWASDYSRYTKHCSLALDSNWKQAFTPLPPYDINSKDGGGERGGQPITLSLSLPSVSDWNEPFNTNTSTFFLLQTHTPHSAAKTTPPGLQMLCLLLPISAQSYDWSRVCSLKSKLPTASLHLKKTNFLPAPLWRHNKSSTTAPILTSEMHQGRGLERPVRARRLDNHPSGGASACQHQWAEAGGRRGGGGQGRTGQPRLRPGARLHFSTNAEQKMKLPCCWREPAS